MIDSLICLDANFATTKCLTVKEPIGCFLSAGEDRQGEGGLRTKGYYKRAYTGKPLVSIVTVVYNGEKYLEETILSIINQTYDNLEYIVIDGGSTDGTIDIIKRYENQIDYWISEKDHGQANAINKGFSVALGDILVWLNYDDTYVPDCVEGVVKHLQCHSDAGFTYSHSSLMDARGRVFKTLYTCKQTLKSYRADSGNIFQGTVFFRKELWLKYGPIDETLQYMFEYKLFDQFFRYEKGVCINDVLAHYRIHDEAISTKLYELGQTEARQLGRESSGFLKFIYRFRRLLLYIQEGNFYNVLHSKKR